MPERKDIPGQNYQDISLEDWKILMGINWPPEVDEVIGFIHSQGYQGYLVPDDQVAIINRTLDQNGLTQYRLLDGKEEWTENLQKFYKLT